ncbi:MAG: CCA tRNA nucleotidyltransferase [Aliishimia sp.]
MTKIVGEWLNKAETQTLFDLYEAEGYQLFFVGGCVRNALLGEDVSDIDMCSNAPPDVADHFLKTAGIRVIPTGLDHGTLTVVSAGTPHEITTFRKDMATDGRRAVVAFSDNIADDARRRDFTINALYADRFGQIVDPLGGLEDIPSRRIRFIEDPHARIQEDYLRILRFFRFHGRLSRQAPEADTLDAIARNIEGLGQLSVERVTSELLKILGLADPAFTVGIMEQVGVLQAVLPGANMKYLSLLIHFEDVLNLPPDPLARLTALGGENMVDALRLSKVQGKSVLLMHDNVGTGLSPAALGHAFGAQTALNIIALRSAIFETIPPENATSEVERGESDVFPVKASDLSEAFSGVTMGRRLKQLKAAWYRSDLKLSKAALLSLPNDA